MKRSKEQRAEIYRAYQLGETLLSLALQFGVKEDVIRYQINRYVYKLPTDYYWLNSPSQEYADHAKETFITISEKYNTPSGVKRG